MIAFEVAMQIATTVAAGDYTLAVQLCNELEDILKIELNKEKE